MKKDNTILWIAGIILLLLVLLQSNLFQKQEDFTTIKVHYYKSGVEVIPETSLFSIVTPPGGSYDQISFDVVVRNTGDLLLSNVKVYVASPFAFMTALPSTIKTLDVGETYTWSSSLIETAQFESMSQPVRFYVKFVATSELGEEIYEFDEVYLSISPLTSFISPTEGEVISGNALIEWDNPFGLSDVYLQYREDPCPGTGTWHDLTIPGYTNEFYSWNTNTIPNGDYCLRLVGDIVYDIVSVIVDATCIETWTYPVVFYDDFEHGLCNNKVWWNNRGSLSTETSYSGMYSLEVPTGDIPSLWYDFPIDFFDENYLVEWKFYDEYSCISDNYNEMGLEFDEPGSIEITTSGDTYSILFDDGESQTQIGSVSRSEGWHSISILVTSLQIQVSLDGEDYISPTGISHAYPFVSFVRAPNSPSCSPDLYIDDVKITVLS